MRTIFISLWNRRRYNVWLFIELILVTILAWMLVDPVAVSVYETSLPEGYDADRLVKVTMKSLPSYSAGYQAEYDSIDANREAIQAVMGRIRAYEGVQSASNFYDTYCMPGGTSNNNIGFKIGVEAVDTLPIGLCGWMVYPDEDVFETFGLEALPGSPSAAELSHTKLDLFKKVIITEAFGQMYWPGENPVGKKFIGMTSPETGDTVWGEVAGVVENMRWSSLVRSNALLIASFDRSQYTFNLGKSLQPYTWFTVVVRVRDGVDVNDFVNDFVAWGKTGLKVGNFYLQSAVPYTDFIRQSETAFGVPAQRKLNMILTGFFMTSLILGTIGCFWLQTRRRTEEIGIRRSFGARRRDIVKLLLGESVVMATISFLLGIMIYMQWALKHGLDNGFGNNDGKIMIPTWVDNFWEHFGIVSVIVYVLIIIGVVIGTLVPAIKAARVNVTDAVRMNDE